ncbi:uncharacterized protein MELLADRAFT_66190 [Melampsora larici-populina 98AG31]|uniref:Uncharacterized protein n=1 Tax=Melampsora larici-populina (strain 98AG31 / pathotype 3-4-7) TaxID=747676 RepID=F4RY73_MELLP|nr:uncharacterized protein MELLADRAFT_66190 [Melampsora larici-populina 98AG31]EGG02688.1 hypothetical protein MELLADRAFT_66190 [Melampsora larici-populina 98AG31]
MSSDIFNHMVYMEDPEWNTYDSLENLNILQSSYTITDSVSGLSSNANHQTSHSWNTVFLTNHLSACFLRRCHDVHIEPNNVWNQAEYLHDGTFNKDIMKDSNQYHPQSSSVIPDLHQWEKFQSQWHGHDYSAKDQFGFDKLTAFGNEGTLRSDFNTFHDKPVEGNRLQPLKNPARLQWKDGAHESQNNPFSMAKNSKYNIPYIDNPVPRAQTDSTPANQMQSHILDMHVSSGSATHNTNTEDQDFMEFILNQDFDQWFKDPHLDVSNEQSGKHFLTPDDHSKFHLAQSSRALQQQISLPSQPQESEKNAINIDTFNMEKIRLLDTYPNPTEKRLKSWGQSSNTAHASEGLSKSTGDLPRAVMLENIQDDFMNLQRPNIRPYFSSKSPVLPSSFDISATKNPNNPSPSNSESFKHNGALESGTTSVKHRPVLGSAIPPRAYYPNVKDIERILRLTGPTSVHQKTSNLAKFESESANRNIGRVGIRNRNQPVESNRIKTITNDSTQIGSRGSSEPELHLDESWAFMEIQDPGGNFPFCLTKRIPPETHAQMSSWWEKAERDEDFRQIMRGNMEDALQLFGRIDRYRFNQVTRLYLLLWRAAGFAAEELGVLEQKRQIQVQSFEFLTSLLHLKGFHEVNAIARYESEKAVNARAVLNQYSILYRFLVLRGQKPLTFRNPVFNILLSFFRYRSKALYERITPPRDQFSRKIFARFGTEDRN